MIIKNIENKNHIPKLNSFHTTPENNCFKLKNIAMQTICMKHARNKNTQIQNNKSTFKVGFVDKMRAPH